MSASCDADCTSPGRDRDQAVARVLIRTLSNPVARRVVIADPHLAAGVAGHGASNLPGAAPHQLGVVTADAVAGVRTMAIIARLGCPIAHYIGGPSATARDLKEVFAEDRIGTVVKLLLPEQMNGPLLSADRQPI